MSDWYLWVFVGVLLAFFLFRMMSGGINAEKAQEYLQQGAILLDVRGSDEFAAGHLPKAVNLPLDQLSENVGKTVSDKETVILCYCLSGMRSGTAVGQLRRMGYQNSFNIGSYSRAMKMVKG